MCKVKDEFKVDKYRILGLDEPLPMVPFYYLLLRGKKYKAISVYESNDAIGILDDGISFLGEEVGFLVS